MCRYKFNYLIRHKYLKYLKKKERRETFYTRTHTRARTSSILIFTKIVLELTRINMKKLK